MQRVGAFAEFERAMLKERTKAGLNAARLFKIHPATVCRLAARSGSAKRTSYAT